MENMEELKSLIKEAHQLLNETNQDAESSLFIHNKRYLTELIQNPKIPVILKLEAINSFYSTRASRRTLLELAEKIENTNFLENEDNYICYKNDEKKSCPRSLISKYFYFKGNYTTPIYDSLVIETYRELGVKLNKLMPFIQFKEKMKQIKEELDLDYDELDAFGWLYQKLKNKDEYISLIGYRKRFDEFKGKLKNIKLKGILLNG